MNTALMFSSQSDEWETPQDLFDALNAEFGFHVDVAATAKNSKTEGCYFGPGRAFPDALNVDWHRFMHDGHGEAQWTPTVCWLNPPYSRCAEFVAKAAAEAKQGCTVVMLIPARTDTRYFHEHIWDATRHRPRRRVEVRFLKGRLKFSGSKSSAPFPSMIVVFRP